MRVRTALIGTVAAAVVTGGLGVVVAQGALASLGVKEPEAKQDIVHALTGGNVSVYPARGAFKAADAAARAAMVKTAMAWARAYTQTAAFKADYDKVRTQAAPRQPKPRTVDEELAKQKAEQQKGIDEAKKNLAKMPADIRPQMEATIKQMEAQIAKQNADPQFASMMRQGLEMQIQGDQKQYQESVARHNERYPADPNALIAKRLREFLQVSQDVDFGAKLVPGPGGKQRFENAAYESKPSNWKLCYRAGKDAVAAARAEAQAWLTAIGG